MCGLFCAIDADAASIAALARGAGRRGPHACGWALGDGRGFTIERRLGSLAGHARDEIWAKAKEIASHEVKRMQKQIAARSAELGIPEQFAPSLDLEWHHRGYGNILAQQRSELRNMAMTRIGAIERKAFTEIELSCLMAQEQIALAGVTSDAARKLIERLPPIETLMPNLSFAEIAGETAPPIAEQLISPNALRQRRYRERHRNAAVTSRNAGGEDDE
jgi:hypothetical protein